MVATAPSEDLGMPACRDGRLRSGSADLKKLGWDDEELDRRRKGDKKKIQLARQLRAETTMSLSWIARRLQMGSWSCVSN
jgi:hypothetical protein